MCVCVCVCLCVSHPSLAARFGIPLAAFFSPVPPAVVVRLRLSLCFLRNQDFVVVAAYRWQPGSTCVSQHFNPFSRSDSTRVELRAVAAAEQELFVNELHFQPERFGNGTKISHPYRPTLWHCSFWVQRTVVFLFSVPSCRLRKLRESQRRFNTVEIHSHHGPASPRTSSFSSTT